MKKEFTRKVRIGSRSSRLALKQVEEILALLQKKRVKFNYEILTFQAGGDRDKRIPLAANTADDFFTDTLDAALLDGKIDIAVHSAKDLPQNINEGLEIFALTRSLDETDSFVGKVKLADLPSGAKVGTSSRLRIQSILEINPHVVPVNIRGTIDERLALIGKEMDGVIAATCALKRLGLTRLIKDILPYETTALQGQLAVVGKREDEPLKKIFSKIDVRKTYGKIFLTGAGPGDPGLITVKGINALKKADVVFYDYLVDPSLLKYAPKAKKIYAGKRKGESVLSQADLCRMLRVQAQNGKTVVRLKGGDPLIFARGAEEIKYLRSYHIEVQVIPGVSSATGIPSSLGIPLTARGISSSVAFISGHAEDERNTSPQPVQVPKADTVVFLMGLTKLPMILQALKESGRKLETPMIIISKGTRSDEKIVCGTIQTIGQSASEAQLEPPALMIAGETVKFFQRPSNPGKNKILYLGTNPKKYKLLGDIIHVPVIRLSRADLPREKIAQVIQKLDRKYYQLILLTSRYGVQHFMGLLKDAHYPKEKLENTDIAVIGKGTEHALRHYGLQAKLVASLETSEGLLQVLKEAYQLTGKKILFPRSALPNPYLKSELGKLGADVTELTVYENKKPPKVNFEFNRIQKVFFTSPSTVRNFLSDYGPIPRDWQILSKGPLTTRALEKAGYKSEVLVYE